MPKRMHRSESKILQLVISSVQMSYDPAYTIASAAPKQLLMMLVFPTPKI